MRKINTEISKRCSIPQLADVEMAVKTYYGKLDLSTADIKELFAGVTETRITELKRLAMIYAKENGVPVWSGNRVPTDAAFKAWGFDIANLETRAAKLKKLKG